jgi:hypothetical protein
MDAVIQAQEELMLSSLHYEHIVMSSLQFERIVVKSL